MVIPDWQICEKMLLCWNMPILTAFIQEWMNWYWICHHIGKGGRTYGIYGAAAQARSEAFLCFRHGFAWSQLFLCSEYSITLLKWISSKMRESGWCWGLWGRCIDIHQPRDLGCSMVAVAWKTRMSRRHPAHLFTFYFHGRSHKVVIFLKCREEIKTESQTFSGQDHVSCPVPFQAYPQKFFLLLIFFFNESSP